MYTPAKTNPSMFKNFFNKENFIILFFRGFHKAVRDNRVNGDKLLDYRYHTHPTQSPYYTKGHNFGNWYNIYRYETLALYMTLIGILFFIIW